MRSQRVGHDWATELNWTEVGTNKQHQNKTQTILKQNMYFLEKLWEFPWIRYSKLQKGAPRFHEMNISLDSKFFPSNKIYQTTELSMDARIWKYFNIYDYCAEIKNLNAPLT